MRSVPLLLLAGLTRLASAVTPITIKGNGFFGGNTEYYVVGVGYQPGGSTDLDQGVDPLSDLASCQRDVYLLQQLGANTIRTYAVNTTLNHDACMSLLAAAGIYVVVDVNAPGWQYSVSRSEPWTSYWSGYMENVFSVIDQFSGYPNVLGFFSSNELANDKPSANLTSRYVRAIQRDMRQYIQAQNLRDVPIGMSMTDVTEFRKDLAHYLACTSTDGGHSDFLGINSYEWCGQTTFVDSGYANLTGMMSDVAMPIFFSEYGCNNVLPRTFGDASAIYSSDMDKVFSGGMVYEFNQETNNYGLVDVDLKTAPYNAKILPDYETLRNVYAKIQLPSAGTANNNPRPDCKNVWPSITAFDAEQAIPQQPPGVPDLIKNGVKVQRGKIINVDLTLAGHKWTITGTDGKEIENPQITSVSGWNSIPTGGSETTGQSSSETSKNAAPVLRVAGGNGMGAVVVAGMATFFVLIGGLLI